MASWDTPSAPSSGLGDGFGRGRGGFSTNESVDQKLRGYGRGRAVNSGAGSSSSGAGFGGGFGRGGGRGGSGDKFNQDKPGGLSSSSNSGGFGGGLSNANAFSSKPSAGGDDENWDEGTTTTTTTSSSWGGGGSSGAVSSTSTFGGGGGGSSYGGGGGFGSRGGGSDGEKKSGCYKCGGDGHFARECPNNDSGGGGGGGSRACFKCGEEGHMSRECPNAGGGGGGGGGGRGCFNCGEDGHMSRECTNPKKAGGGGGGGNKCYNCGEDGHMSRECTQEKKSGGNKCYNCGEDGHMSRECTQERKSGGGGGGGSGKCFNCQQEGHMSRECPNEAVTDPDKPKASTYVPPPPPEDEEGIFTHDVIQGINFDKYDAIAVAVTGDDQPRVIGSFDEAGIHPVCLDNVQKSKYTKPTPVQKYTIPAILKGRDVMACAQTGSGKTAAFLLPIITGIIENGIEGSLFSEVQSPQCVIVGPTRELVLQIRDQALKFAYNTRVKPVVVYGGTSVSSQLGVLQRGCHLVVGTPGRLLDFIERGAISLAKCKYLVLDEADRMLDMGFKSCIEKLVGQLGMPPKTERQTLMFSATFPEEVQLLAKEFLNASYLSYFVGVVGGANTDITQTIYKVERQDKRDRIVSILNEQDKMDRTLIFVEQKRNADFIASFLSQSGFPTTSIHGDRLQNEREEALRDFKQGRAPVLVATSVAARGLDISNVKHVINYDLPSSIDEYVHRIGRTGRCGNIGKATSFFASENKDMARSLIKILSEAKQEVPEWLEEEGQDTYGAGFSGAGGSFGGTDIRTQQFSSSGGDGGGGGGFGAPPAAAAEDDAWD